jgi:hypothetical protein
MILDAIFDNFKSTSNADNSIPALNNNHQLDVFLSSFINLFSIFLSINFLIINRSSID